MNEPWLPMLEAADSDRAQTLAAAPEGRRPALAVLYAFNLEIARLPWATETPLLAEMRLTWWRDVIEGAPAPGAPLAEALQAVIQSYALPPALLSSLVAARQADVAREAFTDASALWRYLEQSMGHLYWAAAHILAGPSGPPPEAKAPLIAFGRAAGLAAFLRAEPALRARGWDALAGLPLPVLIAEGQGALAKARAGRRAVPRALAPALLPGWQTGGLLSQAAADPARVAAGTLGLSEFRRRGGLLWQALTGRW